MLNGAADASLKGSADTLARCRRCSSWSIGWVRSWVVS